MHVFSLEFSFADAINKIKIKTSCTEACDLNSDENSVWHPTGELAPPTVLHLDALNS